MPGFLPTTTPSIGSYGQDVVDRRPVKDPTMESSAVDYNNLRADLAYVAQTAPRWVVRVTSATGPSPVIAFSAPSFSTPQPTVSWVSSTHRVTFGAVSSVRAAVVTPETRPTLPLAVAISGNVAVVDNPQGYDFTLAVW